MILWLKVSKPGRKTETVLFWVRTRPIRPKMERIILKYTISLGRCFTLGNTWLEKIKRLQEEIVNKSDGVRSAKEMRGNYVESLHLCRLTSRDALKYADNTNVIASSKWNDYCHYLLKLRLSMLWTYARRRLAKHQIKGGKGPHSGSPMLAFLPILRRRSITDCGFR